jgi:hypothetical protein
MSRIVQRHLWLPPIYYPKNMSSIPYKGKRFRYSSVLRPALGSTQPRIQRIWGSVPSGVQRMRSEADHLPPSSADGRNTWSCTSTPLYVFIAWCLITTAFTTAGISRRRPELEPRSCGICGWQSGTPSTSVSPANSHSDCSTFIIIYHSGLVQ